MDDDERILSRGQKFFKAKIMGNEKQVYAAVKQSLRNPSASTTTAATEYGANNESTARKTYCEKTRQYVLETGLWLFPSGKIGASPDGIVYTDDTLMIPCGVIEIKCPYNLRDANKRALEEFAESHHREHYGQVQGELAATGLPWCDLVYWSPQGLWKKRIKQHMNFKTLNLPMLEQEFIEDMPNKLKCMHIIKDF